MIILLLIVANIIDKLAKREQLFNFLADVGITMSYGLFGLKLLRKNISIPNVILGLVLLAILSFIVAPTAFVFLFQVLKVGAVEKSIPAVAGDPTTGLIVVSLALLLGGLFLFIASGIVIYGGTILLALIKTLVLGSDAITKTTPGGSFLLPGINLPFFEGVIALAIVMIVHEVSHAILGRIAKVPILSSGIVLFGILPIGAFVEPDEKKLNEVDPKRQTRVL
ncbi:hypothetical protein HZC07_01120, partial [Candidatus Micrarchaeota archaeon]|nr:hypothetical protein [Candidatus Micrarchaeota archaeon]